MKGLLLFLTQQFKKSELDYQAGKHFDNESYEEMRFEIIKKIATEQVEFMQELLKWYDKLTPAQKCTLHAPAGSGGGTGLYNLSHKELVEKFLTLHTSSPKELEEKGV